eukprot:Rmarinus@m.4099
MSWRRCILGIKVAVVLYIAFSVFVLYDYIRTRPRVTPSIDYVMNEGGEMCFSENSMWSMLRSLPIKSVEDGCWDGQTVSFKIVLQGIDGDLPCIFKPLPFHDGPFHGHLENAYYEALAFGLDCTMRLQRVPPVAVREVPAEDIFRAASSHTLHEMIDRDFQISVAEASGVVKGVLQPLIPNVTKESMVTRSLNPLLSYLCPVFGVTCLDEYTSGDLARREIIDHLLGNYDRWNNRFVQLQANGDRVPISLDFNHASHSHKKTYLEHCFSGDDPLLLSVFTHMADPMFVNRVLDGWEARESTPLSTTVRAHVRRFKRRQKSALIFLRSCGYNLVLDDTTRPPERRDGDIDASRPPERRDGDVDATRPRTKRR